LHTFRLKKMAGGFVSASPATVIDVHTAAANIKQTLGADVNAEHFSFGWRVFSNLNTGDVNNVKSELEQLNSTGIF
jgi:hypothetical protein